MSQTTNMLLTTCTWDDGKYESFKLIPIKTDCPYVESFYDPVAKVLVVLGAQKKEQFTLLQKLNEFGYPQVKNNKNLIERQRVDAYKEYYIDRPEEIEQFINMFAFNADTFDYKKYLGELIPAPVKSHVIHETNATKAAASL